MRAAARGVTKADPLPSMALRNVCASMPKKTHFLRPAGRGSERGPFCTATRKSPIIFTLNQSYALLIRCPCLKCTIKIVQNGVSEVVYNLSYKMYVSFMTMECLLKPLSSLGMRHRLGFSKRQESNSDSTRHLNNRSSTYTVLIKHNHCTDV